MKQLNTASTRLLAAGALVAFLGGCASVKPDEFEASMADIRAEIAAGDNALGDRIDGVDQSVRALQNRMNQLEGELETMAAEYDATVRRFESSLRFAAPVHFDFDADEVRDADMEVLMRFASVVSEYYPGALVTVEGFTDAAGSAEYNMQLGQRRADAVRSVLVDQGRLSAERVRAVSYGEDTSRLVNAGAAGGDNPDAMANRRVVLVVDHATQAAMSMASES
jgi:peptidoglycan-associated lipoprotein